MKSHFVSSEASHLVGCNVPRPSVAPHRRMTVTLTVGAAALLALSWGTLANPGQFFTSAGLGPSISTIDASPATLMGSSVPLVDPWALRSRALPQTLPPHGSNPMHPEVGVGEWRAIVGPSAGQSPSHSSTTADTYADALTDGVLGGAPASTSPAPGLGALLAGLMLFARRVHARTQQDPLRPLTPDALRSGQWCMATVATEGVPDPKVHEVPKAASEAEPKPSWIQRIVKSVSTVDLLLLTYLAVWYFGNYKSNISNKLALADMGGASGCPLLVGVAEMFVGVLYALFLWGAPDARPLPKITFADVKAMIPLVICTLGHQLSTVYATSAGSLSSVQILKATEPVFAACFATFVYGKKFSKAKWLSLIPIIGGVCLASMKELSFSWIACACVLMSNVFSAFRSNENKKAMETPGLRDRLGSVGNQFATVSCLCFLAGLPIGLMMEWHMLPFFFSQLQTNPLVLGHIISAGLWFYIYNEVSTLVVKRTGALTQSVLNTAKRVIVIFGAAVVLGEGLAPLKLLGCCIGISGVFLYSVIDRIVPSKAAESSAPTPAKEGGAESNDRNQVPPMVTQAPA